MSTFFQNLRHFSPHERWGDPNKMDHLLLLVLDELREQYGSPFIIHEGYATSGHTPRSLHYVGKAVDFHPNDDRSPEERLYQMAEALWRANQRFIEAGIDLGVICRLGWYPEWVNPGFHLDVAGRPLYWVRRGDHYYYYGMLEKLIYAEAERV